MFKANQVSVMRNTDANLYQAMIEDSNGVVLLAVDITPDCCTALALAGVSVYDDIADNLTEQIGIA